MSSFLPTSAWKRRWTLSEHTPAETTHSELTSSVALNDFPRRGPSAWGLNGRGRTALYSAALAASGLSACATLPPPPTPEMTRTESAIEQAQRAGAAESASDRLQAAQTKLNEAKATAAKGDARRAAQLVDEAYADARLADLTAQSAKSAKAAAEVDKSINTLESETDRPKPL
jgi:hypothetical protein